MALAKKATLKKSGGTAYNGLIALNFGGITWETEDMTQFDSSTNTSLINTVRSHGPITGTLRYDPTDADHAALYAAAISGAADDYVFTYPNTTSTETGECIVTDWKWDFSTKNTMKASFTLSPTGAFTYAA